MKKVVDTQSRRKGTERLSISVSCILKHGKYPEADNAVEFVEVYEAVERTYREAAMAGEPYTGVVNSTNYSRLPAIPPRQQERQGR